MLTAELFIAIIGIVMTAFGLGYAVGSRTLKK